MTNWFITCNWGDVIGVDLQMPGAPSGGGAAVCPLTGYKGVHVFVVVCACKGYRRIRCGGGGTLL